METLTDSIEIECSPRDIYSWLIEIDKNYKFWHKDHVDCYWIKGGTFKPGSILYTSEYIHGQLHNIKFQTTEVVENQYINYKILFPTSMISPKGSFQFHKIGSITKFTATISFRFGWLIMKIAKKRMDQFKIHMNEEGKNLKMIMENTEKNNA